MIGCNQSWQTTRIGWPGLAAARIDRPILVNQSWSPRPILADGQDRFPQNQDWSTNPGRSARIGPCLAVARIGRPGLVDQSWSPRPILADQSWLLARIGRTNPGQSSWRETV